MSDQKITPQSYLFYTLFIIVFSLFLSCIMSPDILSSWATMILVSFVPTQMVVTLYWRGEFPQNICLQKQPLKGILFILLTALVGCLVCLFSLSIVGGGSMPPSAFVTIYLITSVPVTFCLIVLFGGWPFNIISKNQWLQGGILLVAAYAITWLLFHTLFNFSFAQDAPFYNAALDPHGVFIAWQPLTAALDALLFMLLLVLFDFWTLSYLTRRVPLLSRQPFCGLAALLQVALLSTILWWIFQSIVVMDTVIFMVNICVTMIFGMFILLVPLEGIRSLQIEQPWRGLVLTVVAVIFAALMLMLYTFIAEKMFHFPENDNQHTIELWLASSMLSVTFPSMVFFAQYFYFWPFRFK